MMGCVGFVFVKRETGKKFLAVAALMDVKHVLREREKVKVCESRDKGQTQPPTSTTNPPHTREDMRLHI